MDSNIVSFDFLRDQQHYPIRAIIDDGRVWFILNDVLKVLGINYYNSRHVPEEERSRLIVDTQGKPVMYTVDNAQLRRMVKP